MPVLERLFSISNKSNRRQNWDEFDSELYAKDNFRKITEFDEEILEEMSDFYAKENPYGNFLEVGPASNMYPILTALPYANAVFLWEYGAQNVAYLNQQCEELNPVWQQWINKLRELKPEIYNNVDFQQQLKDKVTVIQGSIFNLPSSKFDNISMHAVAESLTGKPREFRRAVNCFLSAGKPETTVVTTFVGNSSGYNEAGRPFPAVSIKPWDAIKIMGPKMQSFQVGSTTAELRQGSPLIKVFGRLKG